MLDKVQILDISQYDIYINVAIKKTKTCVKRESLWH